VQGPVVRVLANRGTNLVLKAEIETCMRLLGAKTVADLGPKSVSNRFAVWHVKEGTNTKFQINSRVVERDIYDGEAGLDRSGLWEKSKL
jgi:hypothetical protein